MTELFVKIPSSALAIGSDKKLTVEEINLFAWLQTMINWLDFQKRIYHISCDLNLLVKVLGLNKNNLSRGKNKVIENLISLQEKGYLGFIETDYKTLEISLNIEQGDVKAKPKFTNKEMKYAGFIKIPISYLNRVETKYDITILALVVLRNGLENYQITRSEWQEVLEVSVKTAVEVVNKCDLVETKIGKYISQNRQEANTYILKGNINTETLQDDTVINSDLKKVNANKEVKNKNDNALKRMHSQVKDQKIVDDFEIFEKLVDYNKKMDSEAYLIYLETEDSKLIEFTERKIDKMNNHEQSKKILDKIISGAHSIKRNREIKKERETFGTKRYFEAELKMYTNLLMMDDITNVEYSEMESYLREQLKNLEDSINPVQFEEWKKIVKLTENKGLLEASQEYDETEEITNKNVDWLNLKEDSDDIDTSSLKKSIEEVYNGDIIFDKMLKKITDKRVMYNKELLKEIQDFNTEMSLYAYEIYMTTQDGQLRKYGKEKLNNDVNMYYNLDMKYRQKHKKLQIII